MNRNSLIYLGLVSLFFISCQSREGCTFPQADNYNSEASIDDGSCYYSGQTVLWYNQEAADFLANDGAEWIYYYEVSSRVTRR